jgi:hypothetical protein
MTYLTWAILSDSDLFHGDKTEDWESQIENRTGKKMRYPIKIKDDSLDGIEINLKEPEVTVVKKNKDLDKVVKIVSKENKKDKKKKLF